jgi:hypothetical protein
MVLATALTSGPAWSLSCMPPDAARTFNWASDSEDTYSAFLGTLDFAPVSRPSGFDPNPDPVTRTARFSGSALGGDGFAPIPDRDIGLVLSCMASWCGNLEPGTRVLAFAKRVAGGYEITVDPCYTEVFTDPAPEIVATVEACMRGGPCEPKPLR